MEDFSTLADAGVLDHKLVWESTFGWHASRYYYYGKNNNSIDAIRDKWGLPNKPDITYYKMLERLYNQYKDNEQKERDLASDEIELGYRINKKMFIHSENANLYSSEKTFREVMLELRPSKINGVGVFAVVKIQKGTVFAEGIHNNDYDESLVPWDSVKSVDKNVKEKILAFCIGTPDGFFPPDDYDFNQLSIEWYMNHSCNGNVGFNENGDFETIIDIEEGKELTYDYALAESNPKFMMQSCDCMSSKCRHVITGDDWKNPEFRSRNLGHMLPKLRTAPK